MSPYLSSFLSKDGSSNIVWWVPINPRDRGYLARMTSLTAMYLTSYAHIRTYTTSHSFTTTHYTCTITSYNVRYSNRALWQVPSNDAFCKGKGPICCTHWSGPLWISVKHRGAGSQNHSSSGPPGWRWRHSSSVWDNTGGVATDKTDAFWMHQSHVRRTLPVRASLEPNIRIQWLMTVMRRLERSLTQPIGTDRCGNCADIEAELTCFLAANFTHKHRRFIYYQWLLLLHVYHSLTLSWKSFMSSEEQDVVSRAQYSHYNFTAWVFPTALCSQLWYSRQSAVFSDHDAWTARNDYDW